jgi:hypothetical protein
MSLIPRRRRGFSGEFRPSCKSRSKSSPASTKAPVPTTFHWWHAPALKKLTGLLSALLVTDENDVRSACVGRENEWQNNATVDNRCGWTQASKIRPRTGTRAPVAELMPSEPFHRFSIATLGRGMLCERSGLDIFANSAQRRLAEVSK